MTQRKNSESSNAFLYEILTKKCSQFLTNCNHNESRQFMQIKQTIKYTASSINQIKTTKTTTRKIVAKNKILVSNIVTKSSFRQVALEQAQQLHKKQEQLLAELMRHIVQNIKLKFERIIIKNIANLSNNKDIFFQIIDILEDQYESINQQLAKVRKYTKRREIKNVINLQIESVGASQFVQLIFTHLPQLKDYFQQISTSIFTNQQLQDMRQYELVQQLLNINELLEQRIKEKKQKKKKRNKKKKNNNQVPNPCSQSQKTTTDESNCQNDKIILFLQGLQISQDRPSCYAMDDWMHQLSDKYGLR